jgi:hypothetical protein
MAIQFNSAKGSAKKNVDNQYKYKDGENKIRIVGDVLARYVYWLKGENDKDIPMECLAFDREEEKFTNAEKDWIRDYYPDKKCTWSYVIQGIDLDEGKLVVVNLKKKLFQQIKSLAEDLGDPTDPISGWDIVFKKEKTGPLPFNVEYTLAPMRCKKRELTAEEKELIKDLKPIDELIPRPTADKQKEFLDKFKSGEAAEPENTAETVDDLPQ